MGQLNLQTILDTTCTHPSTNKVQFAIKVTFILDTN